MYKRQVLTSENLEAIDEISSLDTNSAEELLNDDGQPYQTCLLYTSDAADERSSVDLGGRRIIKKNTTKRSSSRAIQWTKKLSVEPDSVRSKEHSRP